MSGAASRASMKRLKTEAAAGAVATLPDDTLAAVLSRLPLRSVAASRSVCRVWRALVDERRPLAPYLPHAVRGLLINHKHKRFEDHVHRPTATAVLRPMATRAADTSPVDDGLFCFDKDGTVVDHCDGLVLYTNETAAMVVCNPATRQSARLPDCPSRTWKDDRRAYLAFDAAKSRYYQVLVAPALLVKSETSDAVEWPPAPWTWHVFSSKNGQWGERTFVRDGEASGTASDLLRSYHSDHYPASSFWFSATHWQGALYVLFDRAYVFRMCLSNNKYRVIKSPVCEDDSYTGATTYLGKSEKGVYFATVHHCHCQLCVWNLYESSHSATDQWQLVHQSDLKPCIWWMMQQATDLEREAGPWILDHLDDDDKPAAAGERKASCSSSDHDDKWDSDNEDDDGRYVYVAAPSDEELWRAMNEGRPCYRLRGFHPYKEVVYFSTQHVAVAYHLETSKFQHLGSLHLPGWHNNGVSFVYTPCMIGDL